MANPKKPGLGGVWGPAVDPAPDFGGFGEQWEFRPPWRLGGVWGPAVDPAPPLHGLLDKSKIAQIVVRQIDLKVTQLENQLELLRLARDLLKEEHQIE